MERLTKYICDHAHGAEGVRDDALTGSYCRGEFEATAIVDRLAAIEDILGDEYDLDELKEVVQAKREGRCVVLPAPLGSQVWKFKYPTRIDENGEEWTICSVRKATVEPAPFGLTLSMVNQIGKIYWLSEEDALAALRREQDGE